MPKRTPTETIPSSIQLLTVKDLAKALRCSVWSIWAWTEAGILPKPITMRGGKRYWRASTVEAALDALERRTYVPPALRGRAHADALAKVAEEEDDQPPPARTHRERL